jgi:S1-C subfamily serine protease
MRPAAPEPAGSAPQRAIHAFRRWSWREMDGLHLVLLGCAAALVLLATGAGLALGLENAEAPLGSARAGLYAVSSPAGGLSAALTRQVAREVAPAVVDIDAVIETASGATNVAGTGMVLTPDGLVVTNNHVVENAKTITVTLERHRHPATYAARFVGADPLADVAVLRIVGVHDLPTVRFGSSSRVVLGEGVLAFGNALGLGGTASVTAGTVSALGRSITATSETGADAEHLRDMIETDAPIAPGSSGGPLVDARGLVIGMNTAAASATGVIATPLAFALPIDEVLAIARRIEAGRAGGGIVLGRHAYLGIEGSTFQLAGSRRTAVSIIQVEPGTPAAHAGLEPGDVIVGFDGEQVTSMSGLARMIESHRPGDQVVIVYEAGGGPRRVEVRLVAGPAA